MTANKVFSSLFVMQFQRNFKAVLLSKVILIKNSIKNKKRFSFTFFGVRCATLIFLKLEKKHFLTKSFYYVFKNKVNSKHKKITTLMN